MSDTDEIKARLDIVNYVGQYVSLQKAGRYYKACCPFHSENTPSFFVDPERQSWRCYGACAEGGDIISFAQKQHGWDFKEALEALGKEAGVEVRKQTPEQRQQAQRTERLLGLMQIAAETYQDNLLNGNSDAARSALAYAQEKRGFSMETIREFGIGFAPSGWQNILDELTQLGYAQEDVIEVGLAIKNDRGRVYDRFRNRLMIPIRDDRGRVVGFGARALNPDDTPKYMNSPQTTLFDKSQILFGLDTARQAIRDTDTAVIVEGYVDAIQAQQAGFRNVVAQMGTAMTETQLKRVAPRLARKVVLALDSDSAGQNATRRSLETARTTLEADYGGRLSIDIRVLQMPGAKDPDDVIREDPERWQSLIDNATPVADYVIQMETANLPANASVQERESIARQVLPILLASENNLYTQDNLQKLAMKLRFPEEQLLAWAREEAEKLEQEKRRRQQRQEQKPQGNSSTPRGQQPAPDSPPASMDEPPSFDELPPLDPEGIDMSAEGAAYYDVPADMYDAPVDTASRSQAARQDAAQAESLQEAYCLHMLFYYPDVYYHVNRKLRELGDDQPHLLQGPLADFGVGDLTRDDYRALMQMFLFAVRQDESDVLDFLDEQLDPAMKGVLHRLMQDEAETVAWRVGGRFDADRSYLWKQYEKRVQPSIKPEEEIVQVALELRRRRLARELEEFRFMQMNMQDSDPETVLEIGQKVAHTAQAKSRLDEALR